MFNKPDRQRYPDLRLILFYRFLSGLSKGQDDSDRRTADIAFKKKRFWIIKL
ncbi:hypothetical protein BCL90_3561 [Pedobacter alluvionis]|uniref:Uncharacterized protein n=1 Tax=Pedobacter alluvionis TaxID=475253 RepID=A0A497XUW1_9SPHI|nr:hypothetical protein BCL90_3561 [Pedobacter alluvionis]